MVLKFFWILKMVQIYFATLCNFIAMDNDLGCK